MERGPTQAELERAFLATETRRAVRALAGVSKTEFRRLFDELLELPSLDLSLVLPLPALLSPELSRLLAAISDDDDEEEEAFDECLIAALARVDTIHARATLARAVLDLRSAGRVEPRLAAVALVDLEGGGDALLRASLIEAAAIAAGVARTPGGLLVAAA